MPLGCEKYKRAKMFSLAQTTSTGIRKIVCFHQTNKITQNGKSMKGWKAFFWNLYRPKHFVGARKKCQLRLWDTCWNTCAMTSEIYMNSLHVIFLRPTQSLPTAAANMVSTLTGGYCKSLPLSIMMSLTLSANSPRKSLRDATACQAS